MRNAEMFLLRQRIFSDDGKPKILQQGMPNKSADRKTDGGAEEGKTENEPGGLGGGGDGTPYDIRKIR